MCQVKSRGEPLPLWMIIWGDHGENPVTFEYSKLTTEGLSPSQPKAAALTSITSILFAEAERIAKVKSQKVQDQFINQTLILYKVFLKHLDNIAYLMRPDQTTDRTKEMLSLLAMEFTPAKHEFPRVVTRQILQFYCTETRASMHAQALTTISTTGLSARAVKILGSVAALPAEEGGSPHFLEPGPFRDLVVLPLATSLSKVVSSLIQGISMFFRNQGGHGDLFALLLHIMKLVVLPPQASPKAIVGNDIFQESLVLKHQAAEISLLKTCEREIRRMEEALTRDCFELSLRLVTDQLRPLRQQLLSSTSGKPRVELEEALRQKVPEITHLAFQYGPCFFLYILGLHSLSFLFCFVLFFFLAFSDPLL